jgi:hypothetical protein
VFSREIFNSKIPHRQKLLGKKKEEKKKKKARPGVDATKLFLFVAACQTK